VGGVASATTWPVTLSGYSMSLETIMALDESLMDTHHDRSSAPCPSLSPMPTLHQVHLQTSDPWAACVERSSFRGVSSKVKQHSTRLQFDQKGDDTVEVFAVTPTSMVGGKLPVFKESFSTHPSVDLCNVTSPTLSNPEPPKETLVALARQMAPAVAVDETDPSDVKMRLSRMLGKLNKGLDAPYLKHPLYFACPNSYSRLYTSHSLAFGFLVCFWYCSFIWLLILSCMVLLELCIFSS